ncbi:MAG TPA: NrfD/PsrC family molybdoenzyme membrane anchor subunit [Solirubrobacteraceae bacterium]|nr:NrfD/PsrC family molybdoenzyme membrane anchor subunit [Solirubrobacteraceae bacterium]
MSAPSNGRAGSAASDGRARVPDDRRDSYYGMPVINPPVWEEREIAGYLFLGGLAGASSLLAAVAEATDRPRLAQRSGLCASGAIALSFAALIKDLGRPERFVNMLRVFKPTSPMNIGTWILTVYGPLNFGSSASRLTGRLRGLGRLAGVGAGATGTLVSTYTGALIADTAVPAWHEGHRELPFLFASSAAIAAGGAGLMLAPRSENSPAWRLALLGGVGELIVGQLYERRLRPVKDALDTGRAGRRMQLAKALTATGVVSAGLLGRRSRTVAVASGAAMVAASALTRFGIFAAGMQSAEDPRYTVEPQLARRRAGGAR